MWWAPRQYPCNSCGAAFSIWRADQLLVGVLRRLIMRAFSTAAVESHGAQRIPAGSRTNMDVPALPRCPRVTATIRTPQVPVQRQTRVSVVLTARYGTWQWSTLPTPWMGPIYLHR